MEYFEPPRRVESLESEAIFSEIKEMFIQSIQTESIHTIDPILYEFVIQLIAKAEDIIDIEISKTRFEEILENEAVKSNIILTFQFLFSTENLTDFVKINNPSLSINELKSVRSGSEDKIRRTIKVISQRLGVDPGRKSKFTLAKGLTQRQVELIKHKIEYFSEEGFTKEQIIENLGMEKREFMSLVALATVKFGIYLGLVNRAKDFFSLIDNPSTPNAELIEALDSMGRNFLNIHQSLAEESPLIALRNFFKNSGLVLNYSSIEDLIKILRDNEIPLATIKMRGGNNYYLILKRDITAVQEFIFKNKNLLGVKNLPTVLGKPDIIITTVDLKDASGAIGITRLINEVFYRYRKELELHNIDLKWIRDNIMTKSIYNIMYYQNKYYCKKSEVQQVLKFIEDEILDILNPNEG